MLKPLAAPKDATNFIFSPCALISGGGGGKRKGYKCDNDDNNKMRVVMIIRIYMAFNLQSTLHIESHDYPHFIYDETETEKVCLNSHS